MVFGGCCANSVLDKRQVKNKKCFTSGTRFPVNLLMLKVYHTLVIRQMNGLGKYSYR